MGLEPEKRHNPSDQIKVAVYEDFLREIHKAIRSQNLVALKILIQNADTWAYIADAPIAGVSPQEREEILNKAFWELTSIPNKNSKQ
jgi:hypothetical protein